MEKKLNVNTLICAGIALLASVSRFLARHQLEMIEETQRDIRAAIMPRAEIEVRLQGLQVEINWQAAEQLLMRADLARLELDIEKFRKP
jgi:hypothetical protein